MKEGKMKKGKKKALIITVIVIAAFAVSGAVAFAVSGISDIEKHFLGFRTAQTESAVQKGDMTQEQADEYLGKLSERMEENETDAVPPLRGGEKGKRGPKGPNALAIYAELSGTSVDELREACKDGEVTVFALADEAGLLDELKAAMIDDAQARIDQLLADGKIDDAKAAELKEAAEEKISAITADTQPQMRRGPGKGADGDAGGAQGPKQD